MIMTKRRRGYYTYSFYYVDHDSFLCPEQHVPALGSASAFQREARKGMARPSLSLCVLNASGHKSTLTANGVWTDYFGIRCCKSSLISSITARSSQRGNQNAEIILDHRACPMDLFSQNLRSLRVGLCMCHLVFWRRQNTENRIFIVYE